MKLVVYIFVFKKCLYFLFLNELFLVLFKVVIIFFVDLFLENIVKFVCFVVGLCRSNWKDLNFLKLLFWFFCLVWWLNFLIIYIIEGCFCKIWVVSNYVKKWISLNYNILNI